MLKEKIQGKVRKSLAGLTAAALITVGAGSAFAAPAAGSPHSAKTDSGAKKAAKKKHHKHHKSGKGAAAPKKSASGNKGNVGHHA